MVGRTSRHRRGVAGKRWRKRAQKTKKVFSPNLQKATFSIDGVDEQKKVCAKCLKRAKKDGKVKIYTRTTLGN